MLLCPALFLVTIGHFVSSVIISQLLVVGFGFVTCPCLSQKLPLTGGSCRFVCICHVCLSRPFLSSFFSRLKNNLISFICLVASGHVAFILLGLAVLQQYILFFIK